MNASEGYLPHYAKPEPEYVCGQPFTFQRGDRVICNGYRGTVIGMYSAGMVEVWMDRGSVCVPSNYPDCYPVTP